MEWFQKWFGADYLELYAHRDEQEAARQVSFVCETLNLSSAGHDPDARVLDVACGWGRHLAEFKKRGLSGLGIDLSAVLLQKAHASDPTLSVVRADMRRIPCASQTFSLVTSFFTSFGYFNTDAEHQALLTEWRRVLKPGGSLLIDYMHKPFILETLAPETVSDYAEGRVVQRRAFRDGRVEKSIELQNKAGLIVQTFSESVRLYSAQELVGLLSEAGFSEIRLYDGGDFRPLQPASRALLALAMSPGSAR